MYASKRVLPLRSAEWQALHPSLLESFLTGADSNVFQAHLSGDAMNVAEMSMAPAALRASVTGFDDAASLGPSPAHPRLGSARGARALRPPLRYGEGLAHPARPCALPSSAQPRRCIDALSVGSPGL